MKRGNSGSHKKSVDEAFDQNAETELDWKCAARFNKLIWGKWPKSVGRSMFGLSEWLQKKGYVVREKIPFAAYTWTVKKTLLDLCIAEREMIDKIFEPTGITEEEQRDREDCERERERMISEWRSAQRSRLIAMSYIAESNGGAYCFALFREPGTENCFVYVVYQ